MLNNSKRCNIYAFVQSYGYRVHQSKSIKMNALITLAGLLLLGGAAAHSHPIQYVDSDLSEWELTANCNDPLTEINIKCSPDTATVLAGIEFLEEEYSLYDLGFETSEYLPADFDPYEVYVDLKSIDFIEDEEDLGFDTSDYLPEGFNPYAIPSDFSSISYIEEEGEMLDPYVDTAAYLPAGFDPYARVFDVSDITYIEEEETFELGFDTTEYLPDGFDPYSR